MLIKIGKSSNFILIYKYLFSIQIFLIFLHKIFLFSHLQARNFQRTLIQTTCLQQTSSTSRRLTCSALTTTTPSPTTKPPWSILSTNWPEMCWWISIRRVVMHFYFWYHFCLFFRLLRFSFGNMSKLWKHFVWFNFQKYWKILR